MNRGQRVWRVYRTTRVDGQITLDPLHSSQRTQESDARTDAHLLNAMGTGTYVVREWYV